MSQSLGGRIHKPLLEFIKAHEDVDVFCFQEIYNNAQTSMAQFERQPDLRLLETLQITLPAHRAFFEPSIKNVFGNGIFVKNDVNVIDSGAVWLYENPDYPMTGGNHSRKMQWVEYGLGDSIFTLMNVHGVWTETGKGDTPSRIEQSRRIKEFTSKIEGPKILCGDFNLETDTESMHMLEEGMVNLIKTHGITSTRSSFYKKEMRFADYILVSPDVKVLEFKVLSDEVSDHLPLYMEFE